MPTVVNIKDGDPDALIRREWGESLKATLELQRMTAKQLQHELAERGVIVTYAAITKWLRGESAPKPYHQAVLGGITGVPPRSLFPIAARAS